MTGRLTVTERSLLFGGSLLLLSSFASLSEDIDTVRFIWDAFVRNLKVLVHVSACVVVEENVGGYQLTSLLVLTLRVDFGDGVVGVGFAQSVGGETSRYLWTSDVIFSSPESILDLEEFVLFALQPSFLTFADDREIW